MRELIMQYSGEGEDMHDLRKVGDLVRCRDCKHNPKDEWFGCPMAHLNEMQRPETAWCWKGERKEDTT